MVEMKESVKLAYLLSGVLLVWVTQSKFPVVTFLKPSLIPSPVDPQKSALTPGISWASQKALPFK